MSFSWFCFVFICVSVFVCVYVCVSVCVCEYGISGCNVCACMHVGRSVFPVFVLRCVCVCVCVCVYVFVWWLCASPHVCVMCIYAYASST